MIECPWCSNQVILEYNVCPVCNQEVLDEHLESSESNSDLVLDKVESVLDEFDLELTITNKFRCSKCKHDECDINEVAMTGTGLSKVLNIQYQHFLFVSCMGCGFVEIYDPTILRTR